MRHREVRKLAQDHTHTGADPMSLPLMPTWGGDSSRLSNACSEEYCICDVLSTSTRFGTQLICKPRSEDS